MNAQLPAEFALVDLTPTAEQRVQRKIRLATWGAAALAVVVIGGAGLIPIGGAVVAPAQVAPETKIKRIAHPTGGVVSQIYVRDGDTVDEGAVLMRLDTRVSALDAELSQRSLVQLMAQRARLMAEVGGLGAIRFPPEIASRKDDDAREAMATEQRRFALNAGERASLAAQAGERANQMRRQIEGFEAQIASLQKQQAFIGPELDSVRTLKEKGYVTIRRVNEMERTATDLEGSIGALQASIAQANAGIAQANEQRIQIGQTARAQAGAELARVEEAINQQRVASASAGDRYDRSAIRAPYAGTIDKLAYNAVGEVVRPAETIMEIVPRDDRQVFEGMVNPADVDRVHPGQSARIRLSAFNQATTPEVLGKVTFVSADPVTEPQTGRRFYRIRVALDRASEPTVKRLHLMSGMPAELFVETGSRSLLSYISKPIRDQFARAFRD